ncbi:MAG: VWA domain-containing protein [Planctomycetes bacterium]|nr:VWA domain-containing protein [Planctomycetota bacterium]
MQTRHRIPTVFSIYMVDVLCCALGCVILLWQLYHHESEEQSAAAVEANKKNSDLNLIISNLTGEVMSLKSALDENRSQKLKITAELDAARDELSKAAELALLRKAEYDKLKSELKEARKLRAAAEATLALLQADAKDLEKKNIMTAAELEAKIRAHAGLLDKLAEAEKKLRLLTKDLALKDSDYKSAAKKADDQAGLLKLLEQQLMLLRGQNKDYLAKLDSFDVKVKLLEKDLGSGKKTLTDSERRYQELLLAHESLSKRYMISVKDLTDTKSLVAGLESDRNALARKNRDIQAAADNRFEGIMLTGKRVVFLVDMSGSMELIDENTADPDKWPLVCETVGRIMQSLVDLQQYQVILFSDRARYALGKDGRWLDYNGKATAKAAVDALKAVKPKNETNMYDAFAEAFKFRDQGLDTIYVLSDGLPNAGQGLPANANSLTEAQRTEILSKLIRSRLKTVWNRPTVGQQRVHINTIGFFFESPDVGAFLWALARENEGSFVGMSKP